MSEHNENLENETGELVADDLPPQDADTINEPSANEEKARAMGWTPKDEFKGDPAKWCDADAFIKRGEEFIPFLKAKTRRQDDEIKELRAQMRDLGELYTKVEQSTYERAIKELAAKRKEAIEIGDTEAFAAVDSELDKLKDDMRARKVAQKPVDNGFGEAFEAWEEKNSDWVNDPLMGSYAEEIGRMLVNRGIAGTDMLERVEKEVKAKFAHHFKPKENPKRSAAQSVESGAPVSSGGGKSFNDMPAEVRKACNKMADNFFSDEKSREKFKKDFVQNHFSGV